ncbi:MAG: hypothetical protein KAT61_07425 [Gammaproteobacteria bacterium]|nr:hypothetical protein [Gammaproteobacteria bacterium]
MINQIYLWLALLLFILSACAFEPVVGFQGDINPILQKKCQQCHLPPNGTGYSQTGLNMESYESLMNGTVFGKVIIPGDSKRSVLNKLIEGRAGLMMRMPHGEAEKLTAEEVEVLKLWVDQGALNN